MMKIRHGFVSNSSSSGFVVRMCGWLTTKERFLTPEQESMLREYGFQPSRYSYASQVEASQGDAKAPTPLDSDALFYYVVCNEQSVIAWLVKNRIPFHASTHYSHQTIIYDGKGTKITEIPNYGLLAEMHGIEHLTEEFPDKDLNIESYEP